MIVTFDPYANTSADAHASYINFLRCFTAIATANAGTTSITINPCVSNGVVDSTRNCIVSIDANTAAGGWQTSSSHNVPTTSWDATLLQFANTGNPFTYKVDLYNYKGKGTFPYMKMCVHSPTANTSGTTKLNPFTLPRARNTHLGSTITSSAVAATNCSLLIPQFTYGCSATSDFASSTTFPPGSMATLPNDFTVSTQTTSFTLNESHVASTTVAGWNAFIPYNPLVYIKMAVTEDYCIVWEHPKTNSYANNYTGLAGSNTLIANTTSTLTRLDLSHGRLIYMGLRETQPWEDEMNNNPPWVAMQLTHPAGNARAGTTVLPFSDDFYAAYMATKNDAGVTSANASIYVTSDTYRYVGVTWNNATTMYSTAAPYRGHQPYQVYSDYIGAHNSMLDMPVFTRRQTVSTWTANTIPYLPSTDPTTGSLVPPAVPITIKRSALGTWNPGGQIRGMYKSLDAPIATMKYYFSEGQIFTVGGEPYAPVVFNDSMYLIKWV